MNKVKWSTYNSLPPMNGAYKILNPYNARLTLRGKKRKSLFMHKFQNDESYLGRGYWQKKDQVPQ